MGRSSRDDDRKRSRRHDDGDDEERRKRRRRHDDDDRSKDEDRRSSKKSRKKKHHHHHREDGEDRKRRRHRDRDDNSSSSSSSRRHRKHHKKKSSSSSSKKHDKKSSSSSRKDKKNKKHKIQKPDKSRLVPLGDVVGKPPSKLIDSERDYFTYHQHFWVYLYREEGVAFNDLTSEESRTSFERFAERYNRGDLEAAYFQEKHGGFPREVLDECKTTKHSWSFQTNATEQRGLEALQEGVRKLTEYEDPASKAASGVEPSASSSASTGTGGRHEHHQNEHHHHEHRRGKTPEERLEERRANRRLRDHVRTVQEELSGGKKDPGRERQLELRREKADRQHGAARDREDAKAGGVELSDKAIYGGDGSDFQNALAREKQRKANRQQKQTARIEELQNREKERQEEMLAKLGLSGVQPGQKITIAPRKDPPPM